ncbi:MAG: peptidase T, partial [Paludibacteraceae bacterium]|nr:peptidase T [Paludibacteraceae bacterium]
MTSVVDRFIKYVQINTQSNEFSESVPSSTGQWDLARILLDELHEMGVTDAVLTPQCYVYAFMPSNTSKKVSSVGFIAHLDTSPDEKGDGVKPKFKKDKKGNDIITSDGTTLLGADDKSGIAAIMSAIEYYAENPQVKHGDVYIAFTP